ncbi:hypothetical protein NA56DRAFT_365520 [Hyaloscypha hepaticicola]|uniref:Uncharacterized protein n=1 Tax=Hyaloscypha hepaticicola TaxID=2082293 RepID=A0A2J6PLE7_9HELO|nr:hypothetical protein NA56DRAFT_365520 [Hyaloscypha hepaticicola]
MYCNRHVLISGLSATLLFGRAIMHIFTIRFRSTKVSSRKPNWLAVSPKSHSSKKLRVNHSRHPLLVLAGDCVATTVTELWGPSAEVSGT